MEIRVPKTSLIVLCGTAGCGKSTFAAKNFKPTEIVSSDRCRAIVSDEEENMNASKDAFELFYFIIEKRMKLGKLVVADSTALTHDARKKLLQLGKNNNYHVVLIVFDVPIEKSLERNSVRDRKVLESVIEKQYGVFRKALNIIDKEGFDQVLVLQDEDIDKFNLRIISPEVEVSDSGPFDIISDVHGCSRELEMLLQKLGYRKYMDVYSHPDGRKVIFAGDIVDRGPSSIDAINIVLKMISSGNAYYIPGNHCSGFYMYLNDRRADMKNGLETTAREYERLDKWEGRKVREGFIRLYESAPPYLILDGGNLAVTHAGISDDMVGKALIVYSHATASQPASPNSAMNIDGGVSMGGSLNALRYPEKEIVSVKALDVYYSEDNGKNDIKRVIDLNKFSGPLSFKTRDDYKIRLKSEEVSEAVQFLSSKSVSLPWVIYIPPVIPSLRSGSIKQQIDDALRYYRNRGVHKLVAEAREANETSVIILCRDKACAESYFLGNDIGFIYSLYGTLSTDDYEKYGIIQQLYHEFRESGYFEKNNTEFVVIEAVIKIQGNNITVRPVKLVSHSSSSFLDKDSIWQVENIKKLYECSKIFAGDLQPSFEIDDEASISKAIEKGCKSFVIKPLESQVEYRGHMVQPEILCASISPCTGEEYFKLSILAHYLGFIGLNKFLKKKLSNRYFEYIIGCVSLNNKMLR